MGTRRGTWLRVWSEAGEAFAAGALAPLWGGLPAGPGPDVPGNGRKAPGYSLSSRSGGVR